ncbi:hypothetical protein K0M31_006889 [Melipona bicolor]|uniref:Uncharacterized protein n=1 Tax=Melipona bicolor TaxID=60889 RepID=A0AA40FT66_9HYME|nr:hypothetical protein K0M31_006889 [Melipona bicolor]
MAAVKGVPAHTLKRFPVTGSSFKAAWELLRGRYEYGDDEYRLNNRHHRQRLRQRGAVHPTDEVSTAKPNLLSPTHDGSTDLIGDKLDLLTDLPNNLSNGEPLINNDAQATSRNIAEREEDVDIKDETENAGVEVTHGTRDIVTSIDTTTSLPGVYTRKPESLDDSDDQPNASSSSPGIDGGSAPPTLELGVTRGLFESAAFRDDPSVPSTTRTHDGHSSKTIANFAGDLTFTSPTAPPTAYRSHYRGAADQVKRSPKHKSARNRQQAHRDDRCQLNRLRIIGNTCFINGAIRSENITRKEMLRDDNEHHRNRADDVANIPRRHSKIKSVARRNYASAGIQPVAKAPATIGTVPTVIFDTEKPAPQFRSATIQRAVRAKSVDAFGKRDRDLQTARVSRLLQFEGAASEQDRAKHGAGRTARPRSPQDLGPRRESEQHLQLVPQHQPVHRVQTQDSLPANTHVVIHGKMNSKREPLLPDINDAHNANDIIKLTMITPEARDRNGAGSFLATNYGKQQQQDGCIMSDNEILDSSHNIEILQTQCLLKITHENNVIAETAHIHNSLPGFDSKKRKSQADKTLSSLLFDGEYRSRNISEQNDSGIHAVASSESTSPYDEGPQEKGTSATENQQQAHCLDGEESASCSCFNLSSPKMKSSTTSDSSCICSLTNAKTFFGAAYVNGAELRLRLQSIQLPNQLHT